MGRFHAGSKYTAEDIRKQNTSFAKGPQHCAPCDKENRRPIQIPPSSAQTHGQFMPAQKVEVSDAWYKATGSTRPEN